MADDQEDAELGPLEVEADETAGASKVSGSIGARLDDVADDETLVAIVKVSEPGYVPSYAERRAAVSDTVFTANLERGRLSELERDPQVVSVELSERLGRID